MKELSCSTVYRLLHDIGVERRQCCRTSLLIKREDIIAWHAKYIRTIMRLRDEGRIIYYLDENMAGRTVDKVCVGATVRPAKDVKIRGLETGLRNPSGNGSRLIIAHVGSESGFLDGCLDIFYGVTSVDQNYEMDGNKFEALFTSFL